MKLRALSGAAALSVATLAPAQCAPAPVSCPGHAPDRSVASGNGVRGSNYLITFSASRQRCLGLVLVGVRVTCTVGGVARAHDGALTNVDLAGREEVVTVASCGTGNRPSAGVPIERHS